MTQITKETIKQFVQEKNYTEIIFSPKGRTEIWDPRPPFGAPVQPFQELPHDNFVKTTCYITSPGAFVQGSEKDFIEEIKKTNTDFLTELFKWAEKEGVKKIITKASVEATDYIPGTNLLLIVNW